MSLVSNIREGIQDIQGLIQNGRLQIKFALTTGQRIVVALLVAALIGIFVALIAMLWRFGVTPNLQSPRSLILLIVAIALISFGVIFWLLR